MPRVDDATIDASGLEPGREPVLGASATLATGDRFAARYLVDGVLGRGGMGTVFRVHDELLGGELVALKVLDHTSESALARFRREVLLARRITSPHVARTHDFGSHGGVSYLTMELVAGRSLGALLQDKGALAPARAAKIAAAVARGLAAAHEAGVVHRDLKPDNVLLGDDGRVVVTDFGIARALVGPEAARMTGGIAGTPHYMAPEQVSGQEIDARADLFALGVLLFECLTGELPYPGETPIAAAVARLQHAARDVSSVRPVPAPLAALVTQLLERERDKRPTSAAAVATLLEAVVLEAVAVALSEASGSRSDGALSGSSAGSVIWSASSIITPAAVTPNRLAGSTPSLSGRDREHVLAVMPFEHRGDPRDAEVASTVRDELVDLLARTRGLTPLAKSSVSSTTDVRALGAMHIVEASVQTGSGKLRASVRLLDPVTGLQVWTERIEGDYADPFAGPERAAQRIVEALRLALESVAALERVPAEAIEHFVQARKRLRMVGFRDPSTVVTLLERAIELAPTFAPALALHAIACARAWFSPGSAQTRDWAPEVKASTARALERAGHVAESHHAAGMVAWHEGRLREAAAEGRTALAIAPTYADAMAFLGQIETEAGREREGLERIRVAHELEPTLRIGIVEPARWHGLYGDLAEFERLLGIVDRELKDDALTGQYLVRVGAWRGRPDWIERGIALLARTSTPVTAPFTLYGQTALKLPGAVFAMPEPAFFLRTSPRFAVVALQILAEGAMIAGRPDEALDAVTKASESVLADLAWMDGCPLLEPLRSKPEFRQARARVAARVDDIWL